MMTQRKQLMHRCLAQTTLPMAQPSEMETRLRAVLRGERRETMTTGKIIGGVLATFAIIGPLAVLRPVAMASTGVKPHLSLKQTLANMPIQEKKEFVAEVHAYNLAQVRLYVSWAEASAQYSKAIKDNQLTEITPLIAPDYRWNGNPMSAAEAVSALRRRMQQYPGGTYHLILTNADLKGLSQPMVGSKNTAWQSSILGAKLFTVGKETWNAGPHQTGVIFRRRDVWINTPQGWRLQQTQETRW